ncbi:NUDIX domain-containing protein [Pararoseomonas indoligenes]|uniref:GDP-mannose pyrophosphatase n=1 Tax=Roseomonas indoligenes TaxID=2820811 RepID=A0A940N4G7_9PROT|nr:NUDIX domain-containing protein [Pararoseomonas indoligenes]MBP0494032.1 NUDIX domain-containing protein [Pararoseomonas indoligenes]
MGEEPQARIRATKTLSNARFALESHEIEQRRRDGGWQTVKREIYRVGEGAAVLMLDPRRGTVVLVRQFRAAPFVNGDPALLAEACAGMVEEGDTPEETVRKEAEQETGFRPRDLRHAFTLYPSPGATSEKLHLFTARYDPAERAGPGGGRPEEGEDIEVLELPLDRAWAMVGAGEIIDAKTVLLLQHLRLERAGAG